MEVGPGRGALTRPLLARGVRVVAYEVDARLAAGLREGLREEALVLREGDVLRADVDADLEALGVARPVRLVGNLPYESATPMLRAFVRRPDLFARIVAMIQKEVADRILAAPGDEAYGFLTLDIGAHARAERLFDVGPGEFVPPPKVRSTVLALAPRPAEAWVETALAVASAGFSARRKTLRNALALRWSVEKAREAIQRAGLPPEVRAETLGLDAFRMLAGALGEAPSSRH